MREVFQSPQHESAATATDRTLLHSWCARMEDRPFLQETNEREECCAPAPIVMPLVDQIRQIELDSLKVGS